MHVRHEEIGPRMGLRNLALFFSIHWQMILILGWMRKTRYDSERGDSERGEEPSEEKVGEV